MERKTNNYNTLQTVVLIVSLKIYIKLMCFYHWIDFVLIPSLFLFYKMFVVTHWTYCLNMKKINGFDLNL